MFTMDYLALAASLEDLENEAWDLFKVVRRAAREIHQGVSRERQPDELADVDSRITDLADRVRSAWPDTLTTESAAADLEVARNLVSDAWAAQEDAEDANELARGAAELLEAAARALKRLGKVARTRHYDREGGLDGTWSWRKPPLSSADGS